MSVKFKYEKMKKKEQEKKKFWKNVSFFTAYFEIYSSNLKIYNNSYKFVENTLIRSSKNDVQIIY